MKNCMSCVFYHNKDIGEKISWDPDPKRAPGCQVLALGGDRT